jgi:hypothetical protein
MPNGENTDLNTENLQTPAHGRGKLAPPWRPGQSGNPGGRPRRARWLREWCQIFLANHGVAILAEAAKRGDMTALRLILAYGYGNPAADGGKGEGDDEEAGLRVALDLSRAEAALMLSAAPRQKTLREQVEDEVLAREPGSLRATRLLAAGFHGEDDLARAVEAEMKKRNGRG